MPQRYVDSISQTNNNGDQDVTDPPIYAYVPNDKWIHLCNPIQSLMDIGYVLQVRSPIVRSETDIIIPFSNFDSTSFIKYDSITDKSILWGAFDAHQLFVDAEKEHIYMNIISEELFCKFNLSTKEQAVLKNFEYGKLGIIIDNELHTFNSNFALNYNQSYKAINTHTISDISTGDILKHNDSVNIPNNAEFGKYTLIYNKLQMKLLFFGNGNIITYDIKKNTWNSLEITINKGDRYGPPSCAITQDEQYVVLFHGQDQIRVNYNGRTYFFQKLYIIRSP